MEIYINGKPCQAAPDETILEVAVRNDVYVPHLCFHPRTGPAANCRTCVVEVAGMPGLYTSCNTPVQPGMQVFTRSDAVIRAQRLMVDMLLSAGDHNCLSCEQDGHCELQDAAYFLGVEKPSYQLLHSPSSIDDSSEFVVVDRDKCISCGRCVAGCTQNVVNEVLSMANRGFETCISFDQNAAMGSSSCVQCGECMQLCPVGCIIDKRSRGQSRQWDVRKVETICPYCGVGCRVELWVDDASGKVVRVRGVDDGPANKGMLCVKGRFGFDFINSPERLTTPLIRKEGELQPVRWEEAISFVASRFSYIKEHFGPDAIGGLASAKVTNEENYLFQKFIRTRIATHNVDHCARL
jgi:predicted molibdopterin-dependent oxidoreductase YjgC